MHKTAVEIDPLKYYNQSIWVKSKKVLIEDPYAEKYQKSFCHKEKYNIITPSFETSPAKFHKSKMQRKIAFNPIAAADNDEK